MSWLVVGGDGGSLFSEQCQGSEKKIHDLSMINHNYYIKFRVIHLFRSAKPEAVFAVCL